MNDVMHGRQRDKQTSGPAPRFGLPKSVPILVAHLLLNIKKKLCKIKVALCF